MIGDGLGRSHPPLLASLNFEDEMLHECLSLVAVAPFRKSLGIYFVRSTAQLHPSLLDRPIPSQATASVIRTVRPDVNFPIESGARAPGRTGMGPCSVDPLRLFTATLPMCHVPRILFLGPGTMGRVLVSYLHVIA